MLTEHSAWRSLGWFILNVLGKKVGKATLTNKANAGLSFCDDSLDQEIPKRRMSGFCQSPSGKRQREFSLGTACKK